MGKQILQLIAMCEGPSTALWALNTEEIKQESHA